MVPKISLQKAVLDALTRAHLVHQTEINSCIAHGWLSGKRRNGIPRLAKTRATAFLAAELADLDRALRRGDGSHSLFFDRTYWSAH